MAKRRETNEKRVGEKFFFAAAVAVHSFYFIRYDVQRRRLLMDKQMACTMPRTGLLAPFSSLALHNKCCQLKLHHR